MHVAESKDEIKLFNGRPSGFRKVYEMAGWRMDWAPKALSPFQYLHELGMLDSRFVAVHAVHATGTDIRLIRKTGASVVHCPRSNRETGVGAMHLKQFLDAGIAVGLGTDSLASSPTVNLWDEMRYAYRLHRNSGVTPADILDLATLSGARAIGLDAIIGTLQTGKHADIIAVPLPLKQSGDLCSDLIRETRSSIMTMVDGQMLMVNKKKFRKFDQ